MPITAKLCAKLIEVAGANRILTLDLHSTQIQGFFNVQADNLFAAPVLLDYIKKLELSNAMIVSPRRWRHEDRPRVRQALNVDLAIIDKRPLGEGQRRGDERHW